MNIDGADYIAGGTTATGFTSADFTLGRDTTIEADTTATQVFDWMSANAGTGQHFWFNTLTHGSHESTLGPVLDYAYTHYGPGGTNEIWMAPEDEIYSYLLVRDSTTISAGVLTITGSGTVVPTTIVSATATSVPPTATRTPTRVPPTVTRTPTRVPPTVTRTPTRVPPTATRTPTRVPPTVTRTPTRVPPTATRTPTRTALPTRTTIPAATATATATAVSNATTTTMVSSTFIPMITTLPLNGGANTKSPPAGV